MLNDVASQHDAAAITRHSFFMRSDSVLLTDFERPSVDYYGGVRDRKTLRLSKGVVKDVKCLILLDLSHFPRARLRFMNPCSRTARLGGHDPGRGRDAARAGAGVDAVPVARSVEHGRTRAHAAHAAHAAAQFATEFDTELSRTLVSLQVDGQTHSRSELDRVRRSATPRGRQRGEPRLVRDVWLVDTLPGTALPPLDGSRRSRRPTAAPHAGTRRRSTFEAADWPRRPAGHPARVRCDALRRLPDAARRAGRPAIRVARARCRFSLGDDNTLISPVTLFELPEDHKTSAEDRRPRLHARPARSAYVIRDTLLPR